MSLKDEMILRYADRFKQFGKTEEAVGWGKKGRQQLRYQVLYDYWLREKPKSVVDLGAGFGDGCIPFFASGGEKYIGLEISQQFVDVGNETYLNAFRDRFILERCDLDKVKEFPKADLFIASGLFNSRLDGDRNYKFIDEMIRASLSASTIGIAFNFLVDDVDYKEDYIHYSNLGILINLVQKYTKKFSIKKDYFPFEVTLYAHKDDSFIKESSIFNKPIL